MLAGKSTGRLVAFLAMALAAAGGAANWPQWRGPHRDGVASLAPAGDWPAKLKLQWKVKVGEGYSSPVVEGERVFLLTRQGDDEVALCLELGSGKTVWQQRYPAPYEMLAVAAPHGKGPKSTSVIDQGRVYTLGISGILSAFDAASGKLLWRQDFSKQYKTTWPLYGTAMSPLVTGGRVIAHVGGHNDGALIAFDTQSGEPAWTWKGDGPGYASPILATLAGTPQLVTQTQNHVAGLSLDGKLLWQVPFTTPFDQNIVTPVVYNDLVIISGTQRRTFAVRVTQSDGRWSTQEVWSNSAVSMFMSSPVISGDYLFGFTEKRKGSLFCLDARDGKLLWSDAGRQGENALLALAGKDLLVLTSEAKLLVVAANPAGYKPAATYEVAESPTWAHPAIAGGRILIKDSTSLASWSID